MENMNTICGDNRFEIIKAYKDKLIEYTNIEDSPEEMAALDNILFRFWQMGWLKSESESVVRCKDCRHRDPEDHKCDSGQLERAGCIFPVDDDYFCAYGARMDGGV